MESLSRALFQHRRFVQFCAERDFYAGVYSEAVGSARRLRKNAEDEAGKFCRGFWGQRKKVLEIYFALQGVNYVLKFPDSEPTELKEFAAEETLKEDAMKWRFEQYLMTEHGCNYKTKERMKAWLFNMFKKCALDVEKRKSRGWWGCIWDGPVLGGDRDRVLPTACARGQLTIDDTTVYGFPPWHQPNNHLFTAMSNWNGGYFCDSNFC